MFKEQSKVFLEKMFSSDFFKNVDTVALVAEFGNVSHLEAAPESKFSSGVPEIQVGPVISNIPPAGIVINTPGEYYLIGDLSWNPVDLATAITIQADNVVLDFNGFALTAHIQNLSECYTGLLIQESTSVIVRNGSLVNMVYRGLAALYTSGLTISNMLVDHLFFENTAIKNLTPAGFFMQSSIDFSLDHCKVQHMDVKSPSCAGVQVILSNNGAVSHCIMSNLTNRDGSAQGFSYIMSSDIKTQDCVASGLKTEYLGLTDTLGHTSIGFCPWLCIALIFNSCSSSEITGCCDDAHGMSVFVCYDVVVNNFSASKVKDGVAASKTGAKATGLEVFGWRIALTNCVAADIYAIVPQNLQSAGFSAWGSAILFKNCTAVNVKALDAHEAPSTANGYGTGFGWAPDPRPTFCNTAADNVQYIDCTAENCQLGFDTWFHTNSSWINRRTENCPIELLAQPEGTPRTFSMDKCSESPTGKPEKITINNIAKNNKYI